MQLPPTLPLQHVRRPAVPRILHTQGSGAAAAQCSHQQQVAHVSALTGCMVWQGAGRFQLCWLAVVGLVEPVLGIAVDMLWAYLTLGIPSTSRRCSYWSVYGLLTAAEKPLDKVGAAAARMPVWLATLHAAHRLSCANG